MQTSKYSISATDIRLITEALERGEDVRLHPDKTGVKILAERVRVLKKPPAQQLGFSDKRE